MYFHSQSLSPVLSLSDSRQMQSSPSWSYDQSYPYLGQITTPTVPTANSLSPGRSSLSDLSSRLTGNKPMRGDTRRNTVIKL